MDDEEYYLNQIPPPKFSKRPTQIGSLIRKTLAKHGVADVQSATIAESLWREAVGPDLASEARIGNIRRGALYVEVRSSLVLQELELRKHAILKILRSDPSLSKIRRLTFRVVDSHC
jgi:predicted nucleic acid-binding Zn ribbon protein